MRIRTVSRESTLQDRGKDKSLWVSVLCTFWLPLDPYIGEGVVLCRLPVR